MAARSRSRSKNRESEDDEIIERRPNGWRRNFNHYRPQRFNNNHNKNFGHFKPHYQHQNNNNGKQLLINDLKSRVREQNTTIIEKDLMVKQAELMVLTRDEDIKELQVRHAREIDSVERSFERKIDEVRRKGEKEVSEAKRKLRNCEDDVEKLKVILMTVNTRNEKLVEAVKKLKKELKKAERKTKNCKGSRKSSVSSISSLESFKSEKLLEDKKISTDLLDYACGITEENSESSLKRQSETSTYDKITKKLKLMATENGIFKDSKSCSLNDKSRKEIKPKMDEKSTSEISLEIEKSDDVKKISCHEATIKSGNIAAPLETDKQASHDNSTGDKSLMKKWDFMLQDGESLIEKYDNLLHESESLRTNVKMHIHNDKTLELSENVPEQNLDNNESSHEKSHDVTNEMSIEHQLAVMQGDLKNNCDDSAHSCDNEKDETNSNFILVSEIKQETLQREALERFGSLETIAGSFDNTNDFSEVEGNEREGENKTDQVENETQMVEDVQVTSSDLNSEKNNIEENNSIVTKELQDSDPKISSNDDQTTDYQQQESENINIIIPEGTGPEESLELLQVHFDSENTEGYTLIPSEEGSDTYYVVSNEEVVYEEENQTSSEVYEENVQEINEETIQVLTEENSQELAEVFEDNAQENYFDTVPDAVDEVVIEAEEGQSKKTLKSKSIEFVDTEDKLEANSYLEEANQDPLDDKPTEDQSIVDVELQCQEESQRQEQLQVNESQDIADTNLKVLIEAIDLSKASTEIVEEGVEPKKVEEPKEVEEVQTLEETVKDLDHQSKDEEVKGQIIEKLEDKGHVEVQTLNTTVKDLDQQDQNTEVQSLDVEVRILDAPLQDLDSQKINSEAQTQSSNAEVEKVQDLGIKTTRRIVRRQSFIGTTENYNKKKETVKKKQAKEQKQATNIHEEYICILNDVDDKSIKMRSAPNTLTLRRKSFSGFPPNFEQELQNRDTKSAPSLEPNETKKHKKKIKDKPPDPTQNQDLNGSKLIAGSEAQSSNIDELKEINKVVQRTISNFCHTNEEEQLKVRNHSDSDAAVLNRAVSLIKPSLNVNEPPKLMRSQSHVVTSKPKSTEKIFIVSDEILPRQSLKVNSTSNLLPPSHPNPTYFPNNPNLVGHPKKIHSRRHTIYQDRPNYSQKLTLTQAISYIASKIEFNSSQGKMGEIKAMQLLLNDYQNTKYNSAGEEMFDKLDIDERIKIIQMDLQKSGSLPGNVYKLQQMTPIEKSSKHFEDLYKDSAEQLKEKIKMTRPGLEISYQGDPKRLQDQRNIKKIMMDRYSESQRSQIDVASNARRFADEAQDVALMSQYLTNMGKSTNVYQMPRQNFTEFQMTNQGWMEVNQRVPQKLPDDPRFHAETHKTPAMMVGKFSYENFEAPPKPQQQIRLRNPSELLKDDAARMLQADPRFQQRPEVPGIYLHPTSHATLTPIRNFPQNFVHQSQVLIPKTLSGVFNGLPRNVQHQVPSRFYSHPQTPGNFAPYFDNQFMRYPKNLQATSNDSKKRDQTPTSKSPSFEVKQTSKPATISRSTSHEIPQPKNPNITRSISHESRKRPSEDSIAQSSAKKPCTSPLSPNSTASPSSQADETTMKRHANKKEISDVVVSELSHFYDLKKFGTDNPKSLFKGMARSVTYHFYNKNPDAPADKEAIKDYIFEVFYQSGIITSSEDFLLAEN